jgi:hypothetical protein
VTEPTEPTEWEVLKAHLESEHAHTMFGLTEADYPRWAERHRTKLHARTSHVPFPHSHPFQSPETEQRTAHPAQERQRNAMSRGLCPLCSASVAAHRPNRAWACPFDRQAVLDVLKAWESMLLRDGVLEPVAMTAENKAAAALIAYYVTYTANTPEGFLRGAIDIHRSHPVTDFEQVKAMQDLIAEKPGLSDVVITSWRRYEEPNEPAKASTDE